MTDRAVVDLWIICNRRCHRNISNNMLGHQANETAKRLKVRTACRPRKDEETSPRHPGTYRKVVNVLDVLCPCRPVAGG